MKGLIRDKKSEREGIPLGSSRNCLGLNLDCLGCPNEKDRRKIQCLQRLS